MSQRAIRIAVCVVLLISVGIGWQMLLDVDRQAAGLTAEATDVDARLNRITDALHGIAGAQHSYLAPGQADAAAFERMSTQLRQYYDEIAAVGPALQSLDSGPVLERLAASTEAVIAADGRAREGLRVAQQAVASDAIYSQARTALDSMLADVRALQAAERAQHDTQFTALGRERWIVVAAAAAVWAIALLLIVLVPGKEAPAPAAAEVAAVPVPAPVVPPSVDLQAAADVCVALSRVASADALPQLLSRAADVIGASGIILWMAGGEELFAVTAHGYNPKVIAKLGPIGRGAENATAAAWRDGRVTLVPAESGGLGALGVPMFGPDACIGVLSVELRHGREADPPVQAVASMVAAQLATAVSAWPAASQAQAPLAARA
jgi:hypothetical protein